MRKTHEMSGKKMKRVIVIYQQLDVAAQWCSKIIRTNVASPSYLVGSPATSYVPI